MMIYSLNEIETFNKPQKGGCIDLRADHRMILNKSIQLIYFLNNTIIGQTLDLSCNGLKIELQNKKQNIIHPYSQVLINSTWIKAKGVIKHVEFYNNFIVVGVYLDNVKFKRSLFVDLHI